jgi:hypothetical protein
MFAVNSGIQTADMDHCSLLNNAYLSTVGTCGKGVIGSTRALTRLTNVRTLHITFISKGQCHEMDIF